MVGTRHVERSIAALVAVAGLASLAGCGGSDGDQASAATATRGTVGLSISPPVTTVESSTRPKPSTSTSTNAKASTSTSTTRPAPTTTTTTLPPPTTTLPPTTTTTTLAPTTTTSTLPPTTTTTAPPVTTVPVAAAIPAIGTRSGDGARAVQARLVELGFWMNGIDGKFGLTTKQAVMAFQKYISLPATGSVDEPTAAYLTAITERAHGRTTSGSVIEVDKARQLIFVVVNGSTVLTLNTSTASGKHYREEDQNTPGEFIEGDAVTPNGNFKVNRERPVGWWEGDLGKIYRPKYFNGGIAIHGSNSIPNYPASHGCVRVSLPAMDMIWAYDLMPIGRHVIVYSD